MNLFLLRDNKLGKLRLSKSRGYRYEDTDVLSGTGWFYINKNLYPDITFEGGAATFKLVQVKNGTQEYSEKKCTQCSDGGGSEQFEICNSCRDILLAEVGNSQWNTENAVNLLYDANHQQCPRPYALNKNSDCHVSEFHKSCWENRIKGVGLRCNRNVIARRKQNKIDVQKREVDLPRFYYEFGSLDIFCDRRTGNKWSAFSCADVCDVCFDEAYNHCKSIGNGWELPFINELEILYQPSLNTNLKIDPIFDLDSRYVWAANKGSFDFFSGNGLFLKGPDKAVLFVIKRSKRNKRGA